VVSGFLFAAPLSLHAAEPEVVPTVGEGGVRHEEAHSKANPLVENWWSWDYGPGKQHKNPPFGFTLINFAVFLLILNKLGGKDLREFVNSRHTEVRKALDRARELELKAQEQLRELEERTRRADAEVQSLLTSYSQQAESERQHIIARAEADAQKLLRDAESQVQVALDAAKRELEQKAALLAVDIAEKLVTTRINDADQHRLVDRYVAQVEHLAGRGGPAAEGQV
jgi:F-type H+-transporting ATPase subunit b